MYIEQPEVIELAEHWHYAPKAWWMVQGNRKVKEGSPEYRAAIRLGELTTEHKIGLKVGAYGDYVDLLTRSNVLAVCHICHECERVTKVPEHVQVVDCMVLAGKVGGDATTAWYLRLDQMTRDIAAAIYFPGGPGTRLHMTPIGFNLANLNRGKPLVVPKIALIGWRGKMIEHLIGLWQLEDHYRSFGDHMRWRHDRPNTWIVSFNLTDVDRMVDWLIS